MSSAADKAAFQAAGLACVSNLAAQGLTAYRKDIPFRPDWLALMQFVLFALVTTPPNYKFQTWLERVWPGYHLSPTVEEKAKPRQVQQVKKLNFRNTAIKFALDQLVSTTVNTYIFIIAFALFKGKNVVSACQNEFWPMRKAALKVWPMVSLLSFTVVPVQHRILFANMIGVVWGIFLSIVVARG